MVYSPQAQHNSVAQLVSLEFTEGTCEFRRLIPFIYVGPVYHNPLTNRAALLCRTQRKVAGLCSSNVSDTANKSRKTRQKKSSAVPPFRSGHMSAICARLTDKGKVGVQRGRETAGVPSFLPPPRVRHAPAAAAANPTLSFSGKLSAPSGRTRLRQFVFPSHPVQEKGAVQTAPISPGKQ